jgi:integrase/recombinase XerD
MKNCEAFLNAIKNNYQVKKLPLTNPAFEYLEKGFREWLDILGYCEMSVYNMPHIIREFLYYLEKQQVKQIKDLDQSHIRSYYHYIGSRGNQRRGGGLSNNYLNKHLQAIEKFLEYLNHKGGRDVPTIGIRQEKLNRKEVTVLATEEIKLLFKATCRETTYTKQEAMNSRDRTMLVIYYSCGLRRNEGVHLAIDDINFDTRLLHVRKGKNYKERFVPVSKASAGYLQEYVYDHRPLLTRNKKESALFISVTGKPMTGDRLYNRLKLLQALAGDIALEEKTIGLHTLRHSIATHLLAAGMSLEKIARFLGHSSLDSTQIYTHLAKQTANV